ncbi:MAG: beta-galactosidase [Bacteroidales bacterium]|nr:beta-galactosidase [Bacteroidales bacterium]
MKRITIILSFALALAWSAAAQQWAPAGDRIRTPWAEKVDPSCPLPEYPRPQMVRADWQNLNGLWDYAITPASADAFKAEGKILVPFPVESSLSGVARTVSKDQSLWYERSFTVPAKWKGKDVILHFGAVDWHAEVWLNGVRLGEHKGGYVPFSFNITSALKKKGPQVLRIKVIDPTDLSWIPRGKQVTAPRGIWYTPVTGIWQTVWMEPVAKARIEDYDVVSDIDAGTLTLDIQSSGIQPGDRVVAELIEGGVGYSAEKPGSKVLASADAVGGKAVLKVAEVQTWSPDRPYLYGLRLSVVRKGKVVDAVDAYTAMRKISRETFMADGRKYHGLGLNGKALFQIGPLDQGWWPDGLYTAPTDEALRFDVAKTREWGFNMIRKHIKVEPARWFYWCDAIGIIVWQDMPCIGDHSYFRHHKGYGERTPGSEKAMRNKWNTDAPHTGTECDVPQEWKDNYYREWGDIIRFTRKFPCVAVWVPFNEAWGQFDTKEAVEFTRKLDPTRLINEASGGNYRAAGDILDLHHYPTPAMHYYDIDKINVLGEFGGIGYPEPGHLWQQGSNWGYNGVKKNHEEVISIYEDFIKMLEVFARTGCAAAVYTQTTDVEIEVNGIMTYDRKVIKMDEARLRKANEHVIRTFGTY